MGCGLPTLIESNGRQAPPIGASLFVINASNKPIEKITIWKTFIQGWDPDYQMALAQRDIEQALSRCHRLAPSQDKAGLILRLDAPGPESEGVFEEVKIVDPSSGKVMATANKKGDNWDEAVQNIINWIDHVSVKGEGIH